MLHTRTEGEELQLGGDGGPFAESTLQAKDSNHDTFDPLSEPVVGSSQADSTDDLYSMDELQGVDTKQPQPSSTKAHDAQATLDPASKTAHSSTTQDDARDAAAGADAHLTTGASALDAMLSERQTDPIDVLGGSKQDGVAALDTKPDAFGKELDAFLEPDLERVGEEVVMQGGDESVMGGVLGRDGAAHKDGAQKSSADSTHTSSSSSSSSSAHSTLHDTAQGGGQRLPGQPFSEPGQPFSEPLEEDPVLMLDQLDEKEDQPFTMGGTSGAKGGGVQASTTASGAADRDGAGDAGASHTDPFHSSSSSASHTDTSHSSSSGAHGKPASTTQDDGILHIKPTQTNNNPFDNDDDTDTQPFHHPTSATATAPRRPGAHDQITTGNFVGGGTESMAGAPVKGTLMGGGAVPGALADHSGFEVHDKGPEYGVADRAESGARHQYVMRGVCWCVWVVVHLGLVHHLLCIVYCIILVYLACVSYLCTLLVYCICSTTHPRSFVQIPCSLATGQRMRHGQHHQETLDPCLVVFSTRASVLLPCMCV